MNNFRERASLQRAHRLQRTQQRAFCVHLGHAPRSARRFCTRMQRWLAACVLAALSFPALPGRTALPVPEATIPLEPLGYRAMSKVYILSRDSTGSLDFIDDQHLLFTFHVSHLMTREAEQSDADQIIRAVVLEVPSGKVAASTEWRLRDRRPYLFPLGHGAFLVRRGNDVERMGADLQLHPFLRFQHHVEAVSISPDGKLLTVQTDRERHSPEKHKELVEQALAAGEEPPEEDITIQMLQLDQRHVLAEAKSDTLLRLAATSSGYVDHEQRPDNQWNIQFHPFAGKDHVLTHVHSLCRPLEDFISDQVLMLTACSYASSDRLATAVNLEGKELWKGQWSAQFISPNFAQADAGQDFAISWIVATHPVDAFFSLSDEDIQGQVVQVLSTATGRLLLNLAVSPVSSAGQNFALSADGRKLAVVNNGKIEIYAVPADRQDGEPAKGKSSRKQK